MFRAVIERVRAWTMVLAAVAAMAAHADEPVVSPLAPPDTSSPRATFQGFRADMKLGFGAMYQGRDDMLPIEEQAVGRAIGALDVSRLPPVRARRLAIEAALLLTDVLDRLSLPAVDEIPDEAAMAELPSDAPREWRVPGTEIEIARITQGPRTGQYLFSADTVARAWEFYTLSANMPYKPGAMEGLYARLSVEPGPWIPSRWIRALPSWAKASVVGQSAWKWIALVITTGAWVLLVYLAYRVTHRKGQSPRYWIRFVFALLLLPITSGFRSFFDDQLIIVGPAYSAVDNIMVVLFYLIWAVAVLNLGAAVARSIVSLPKFETRILDANFITVSCHAVAWIVAVIVVAKGASDIGVPIAAVITSLGVGGLAVALAAGPTLQNLIAGVTLYLDKPIRVGEFCQFGDVLGTVERIGLRSTRIRRWGGNVLAIPNSQFVEQQLDNYNDARYIWIRERLRLRYETTPEQIQYILAKIREMLFAHPKILAPRARLIGFGDDALTVEVLCYTDTGVWAEWHGIREDMLLRIMAIVEEAGTRLALPSKTMYVTRDEGLDEGRKQAAEHQVAEWSEAGELPFPDMSEAQREALAGTLDYPPTGSVGRAAAEEKD